MSHDNPCEGCMYDFPAKYGLGDMEFFAGACCCPIGIYRHCVNVEFVPLMTVQPCS